MVSLTYDTTVNGEAEPAEAGKGDEKKAKGKGPKAPSYGPASKRSQFFEEALINMLATCRHTDLINKVSVLVFDGCTFLAS